jgi:hypothetical protein
MTAGKRDADSMVSGVTLLTISFSLVGQLVNPNDTGVGLGMGGLGEPDGLELLGLEHRAQDGRVHLCGQANLCPNVVDAHSPLGACDLNS